MKNAAHMGARIQPTCTYTRIYHRWQITSIPTCLMQTAVSLFHTNAPPYWFPRQRYSRTVFKSRISFEGTSPNPPPPTSDPEGVKLVPGGGFGLASSVLAARPMAMFSWELGKCLGLGLVIVLRVWFDRLL